MSVTAELPPRAERRSGDPSPRSVFWRIVALVAAVRVILEGIGLASLRAHGHGWGRALEMWSAWDAPHYLRLAEVGYRPHTVPSGDDPLFIVFFPFFPLAVRIASVVFRNLILSGLVVSFLASIGSGWFLYKLVRIDAPHDEAWRAVLLLFAFPTAYFLAAPYTEALFLFAVLACMYAARTDRWARSGFAGALATGTRVAGIALIPALVVEARGRIRRMPWIALTALGLLVYLAINQIVHGDPLWFLRVQREHWYQHAVPPWEPIVDSVRALFTKSPHGDTRFIHTGRLIGFVFGVVVLVPATRRLRAADAVYAWSGFVLVLSASWLLSLPRYLIALYPIFTFGARQSRRRTVLLPLLAIGTAVQGWLFWRYSVGAWTF